MATYQDKEYWRNKSAWNSPDLTTIDGRKLIFLLEALDLYGRRVAPEIWPLIDAVYKDKSLYHPPIQDSDWPLASKDVYTLLHSWNHSFEYKHHLEPFAIGDTLVISDWYEFSRDDLALAETIARSCEPINQEHAKIHADTLDALTEAFASGKLTAYRVELKTKDMAALAPSAWYGRKEITDKRFFFGEIALDDDGRIRDTEKGAYKIYVDEAEFATFLDRIKPPPVTLEAWLEARIRHYDSQPKSVCANMVDCKKDILQDPRTQKFNMNGIGVKIEAAFQKVKPQLVRFGKRGVETGTSRNSK